MAVSTTLCQYFLIIIGIFVLENESLDCSQYTDYDSCRAEKYCSYQQFQCVCVGPVVLDILFTISTSSYIGQDNFDNIIKPWLIDMRYGINVGVTRIGWDIFSNDAELRDIQTTTYNEMLTYITDISYDGGVADLAEALQDTQKAFANSPYTSRKLNFIIMGTNPYREGTTTAEVCQYASDIKQLGIEVVFIGIGHQWKEARIDCLVGDTSKDIIKIDSYSHDDMNDALSKIYEYLCPINPNIKITEVKPVTTTSAARFVEFFNNGIQIQQNDVLHFNGLITGDISTYTIPQGIYFVLYNSNDGDVTCSDCDSSVCTVNITTNQCQEALYIPCGSEYDCSFVTTMSMTDWNIFIEDDDSNIVNSVTYTTDSNYWAVLYADYSYSLLDLGYNNEYGANYARSCTMNGSPGSPSRRCSDLELECTLTAECTVSGDVTAFCSTQSAQCICSMNGFYPKQGSCYPIPEPSNCIAYIVKNNTKRYTRFEFNGAPFDQNEEYAVRYYQTSMDEQGMVTVIDVSRIRTEDDLFQIPGMSIAGYVYTQLSISSNTYRSSSWITNCTIETQQPTVSPTQSPSMTPTQPPTTSPTQAPTWRTPGVYLSGDFCNRDRCNCNGKGFECCLQDNITPNCTQQQLSYTVGDDVLIFNSMKIFPENFPYSTMIHWRIRYNGTIKVIIPTKRRRLIDIINGNISNPLGITIEPIEGNMWLNGTTSINVGLRLNETEIICPDNNTKCKDDLIGLSAVFIFEIINCSTNNMENMENECDIIYPSDLLMIISRSDSGGGGIGGGGENKISTWIWIVLAACFAFLLLLSWLLYRYWYKGRKQSVEYAQITDDIEFQKQYNDEGIQERLDNNPDTNFNPLATGMPGKDKENDPLTVERQKREEMQKNEMVEPDAIKQVFKEEMGQIHGQQKSSTATSGAGMKSPLLG